LKKYLVSVKFNIFFFCGFFFLNSASAQTVPSKLLNDVRSFEVTASIPSKNMIIAAWMERRPNRKDDDESAKDMRVAYKFSMDNGDNWTDKGVIDLPNTFGTGNPYLTSNAKGETFLTVMHIGNKFYEGNISLYEFDFNKNKFHLKSVPFETDNMLLDKPAIAAFGNEIHLVYIAYPQGKRNSLKYQMSRDKGKSWTEPVTIYVDQNISHLGPSIALLKGNQVVISCGSYGSKNIYIIKKKADVDSIVFEKPIVVSKVIANHGAAMSELSINNNRLVITWQSPHQPMEVWMSYSTDEGNQWSSPFLLTPNGNLLSATFDKKGILNCLYSDFNNKQFSVLYKSFDLNYKVLNKKTIKEPVELPKQDEYIGAFQKLLINKSNYYGFWIDYANNSELMFSNWKN
jgi:hypothetical protein